MITPTRFGLKYAPIPTLALEYEDDLKTLDDGLSTTSLYVYSGNEKQHEQQQQLRRKKLHVVELPALTKHSEPVAVARQLQQDNRRFLAPDVVKEDQLVRLLERLMAHLQATDLSVSSSLPAVAVKEGGNGDSVSGGGSMAGKFGSHASDDDDVESDLEQSALDESIAEVSASMDASKAEGSEEEDGDEDTKPKAKSEVGATISESAAIEAAGMSAKLAGGFQPMKQSQEAQDDKDDDESTTSPAKTSKSEDDDREAEDVREAQEDAAKRRALKSESEASDDNEEDIQSEELEYFSEDASDEDSF